MKGLGNDFSTAVLLEVRTDNGSAAAKKSATTQSVSTHFAGRSTKSVSTSPDHLPAPLQLAFGGLCRCRKICFKAYLSILAQIF